MSPCETAQEGGHTTSIACGDEETIRGRSAQPGDDTINTLASALAETVADTMEQAGIGLTFANIGALTSALNKALVRVGGERERVVRQSRLERRTTWVTEQGLLSAVDTARRLGLTLQELETAQDLALIAPVEIPLDLRATSAHFTPESWRYYVPGITLTDTARAHIAHGTLLTRAQAAARLGVPLPMFDHLRLEHGLSAVDQTHAQGGAQRNLYRTDAVDEDPRSEQHGQRHC
ncbi:MAG TPA: hypothetical protein VJY65_04125 [Chloroflexota bacterium]|nr:hypothetical protein [Chloroflexota bacterium]